MADSDLKRSRYCQTQKPVSLLSSSSKFIKNIHFVDFMRFFGVSKSDEEEDDPRDFFVIKESFIF